MPPRDASPRRPEAVALLAVAAAALVGVCAATGTSFSVTYTASTVALPATTSTFYGVNSGACRAPAEPLGAPARAAGAAA